MLVARNAARPENSLGWMLPPELDVELIAVLAGIKPALRSALRPELANNATARLQSLGLAVCSLQQPITFDGAPWTILYGARENAIAAALQELEGRQFNLQEPEYSKVQREIGRLLGFPDCCVKAFCQRLHPPETAGGVTNYPLDDAYLATAHAWTEKAAARLNPLLFGEQTYLISFEPCSFRCPEALRVADAIAGAVSAHHPEALARLDHALAVPIAVHPSGARARLVLERTHKKIYIQTATPIRRVHGEPIPEAYKQIAGSLIGAEIGTDGRVFGSGTPPVIVVDFKTQCGP